MGARSLRLVASGFACAALVGAGSGGAPSAPGPTARHPYAVVVDSRGRVFVADGASRRILQLDPATGRLRVHATGVDEPTGLAAAAGVLYVADFNAGLVRKVSATGRVTTLARLPQVTAVAALPSRIVYAVTMDGTLARISVSGAITRIRVPGQLDRPHGVTIDRDGQLLVAEDSRRVRRVNATHGESQARRRRVWTPTGSLSPATEPSFSPARP